MKLVKFLRNLVVALLIMAFIVKAPELHYNYVRNKVQKTTVMVTNKEGNSGGSGSHIKAPSGKIYILTNAHVCNLSKDGTVYITDDYGRTIPRRIIEKSDFTDLCLVEALPNYHSYLKVGSEPSTGQIVAAVGHPALMPTTMTRGEIIGQSEVDVFDFIIGLDDDGRECNLPKNKIIKINSIFGQLDACVVHLKANLTTTAILPGNSGSPMVDFYGNMVGVYFAGNRANWGIAITVADINAFLKPY